MWQQASAGVGEQVRGAELHFRRIQHRRGVSLRIKVYDEAAASALPSSAGEAERYGGLSDPAFEAHHAHDEHLGTLSARDVFFVQSRHASVAPLFSAQVSDNGNSRTRLERPA